MDIVHIPSKRKFKCPACRLKRAEIAEQGSDRLVVRKTLWSETANDVKV